MEPRWVNTCERLPEDDKEVHVLVVSRLEDGSDVDYARAKHSSGGWVFVTKPPYAKIVAWMEPYDISLPYDQLSRVSKTEIRF